MTYPHNENDNRRGDSRSSYPDDRRGNDRGARDDQRGENKPKERELYPEGTYPVVAVGHRFGFTSNKNPQIGIRLRIVEGELKDKTLLYYGVFTADSEEFTIKALRALGMYGDDVYKDISQIYNGTVANAVYAHEVYQGKKQGKVNWINGADVVMKDEMDENDLRAFAQRMRGAFKRIPGSARPAPSSTPAQGQTRSQTPQEPRGERQGSLDDRQRGRGEPPPPSDDDAPWRERGR